MKETGLPSLFIDIMMLRPEVRTSQIAVWPRRVGDLDDRAWQAEVAHQLIEAIEAPQVLRLVVLGELDAAAARRAAP